ncbi:MAG: hypothetical protein ACLFSZ_04595, partial [Puniceicoccaceae bacterium]
MIQIETPACEPLDTQCARAAGASALKAFDGMGREYARAAGDRLDFTVSGALGWQVVAAYDERGVETART